MISFGFIELLVLLFILLFIIIIPLIALVDILKSRFEQNDKLVWALVVIFLPFIGSILYFIIGRNKKIREY